MRYLISADYFDEQPSPEDIVWKGFPGAKYFNLVKAYLKFGGLV